MKEVIGLFKDVIIYYPEDNKILKQIHKEIAAYHSLAALKYMDTLKLDNNQKIALIDSIIEDLKTNQLANKL
jgi:hypothetical protein